MKTFTIPVVWQMYGHITVQAVDLDEALDKAAEAALPTDGSYIEGSFEIDFPTVEEKYDPII